MRSGTTTGSERYSAPEPSWALARNRDSPLDSDEPLTRRGLSQTNGSPCPHFSEFSKTRTVIKVINIHSEYRSHIRR